MEEENSHTINLIVMVLAHNESMEMVGIWAVWFKVGHTFAIAGISDAAWVYSFQSPIFILFMIQAKPVGWVYSLSSCRLDWS